MMLEQHAVQEHKRRQTLAALGDTSALLAGDVHYFSPLILLPLLLPVLHALRQYTLFIAADAA
jgi:hypothetical protein